MVLVLLLHIIIYDEGSKMNQRKETRAKLGACVWCGWFDRFDGWCFPFFYWSSQAWSARTFLDRHSHLSISINVLNSFPDHFGDRNIVALTGLGFRSGASGFRRHGFRKYWREITRKQGDWSKGWKAERWQSIAVSIQARCRCMGENLAGTIVLAGNKTLAVMLMIRLQFITVTCFAGRHLGYKDCTRVVL